MEIAKHQNFPTKSYKFHPIYLESETTEPATTMEAVTTTSNASTCFYDLLFLTLSVVLLG